MVPRKRNLLEAFQSARHEPETELPPAIGESSEPRGPAFSSFVPRSLPELPRWLPWVVAIGLAFLFGILIGRGTTDDTVEAAGQSPTEEEEEVASAPASVTPPKTTPAAEPGQPGRSQLP